MTVFVSFTTAPEVIEWGMNVVDRKVSEARKIRLPIVDAVWVLFYFGFPNEDRRGTEGTGPFVRTPVLVLRRS